jgi:hypothetical protein
MSFDVKLNLDTRLFLSAYKGFVIPEFQRAALTATDRARTIAQNDLRAAMRGAGLGRLPNAIGSSSDKSKGRGIHRTPTGFSASGTVYVRGESERTRGAIEAYTEGANILPLKGQWLWIATPEIPSRSARKRMTPALYRSSGLEAKIGPLIFVRGRTSNEALLIVKNVTVDRAGRSGKARRLPKRGAVGATRVKKDSIIAFIGIKRTVRTARVNPRAIFAQVQRQLPALFEAAINKG